MPEAISIANGPELAGKALDAWACRHGVGLEFSTPVKPVENAYIESFSGKVRDECLDQHWFLSLSDARSHIERWRIDYNEIRPYSALNSRTPFESIKTLQQELPTPHPAPGLSEQVA